MAVMTGANITPKVGIGPTTIGGSTITLAAYVASILQVLNGGRDLTVLAPAIIGTIALIGVLAGRFRQANTAIHAAADAHSLLPLEPLKVDAEQLEQLAKREDVQELIARVEALTRPKPAARAKTSTRRVP